MILTFTFTVFVKLQFSNFSLLVECIQGRLKSLTAGVGVRDMFLNVLKNAAHLRLARLYRWLPDLISNRLQLAIKVASD